MILPPNYPPGSPSNDEEEDNEHASAISGLGGSIVFATKAPQSPTTFAEMGFQVAGQGVCCHVNVV